MKGLVKGKIESEEEIGGRSEDRRWIKGGRVTVKKWRRNFGKNVRETLKYIVAPLFRLLK
jgi:hypothetical protein